MPDSPTAFPKTPNIVEEGHFSDGMEYQIEEVVFDLTGIDITEEETSAAAYHLHFNGEIHFFNSRYECCIYLQGWGDALGLDRSF